MDETDVEMNTAAGLVQAIDKAVQAEEEGKPRRGHLGASVLGKPCARAVWYGWRWAHQETHTGRMLRLFSRGHKQEDDVVKWLRMAGVTVQDYSERLIQTSLQDDVPFYCQIPWEQALAYDEEDVSHSPEHIAIATAEGQGPKQWRFRDGHIAGDCDGKITAGLPIVEQHGPGLLECKTVNSKGFKQLAAKKVVHANPTHFVQMQVYMHYFKLKWALYVSVCKDDDHMHTEFVMYKPSVAEHYIARAKDVAASPVPPLKISENASWWQCKFCSFKRICHEGQPAQKNCRSCRHALPGASAGEWHCGHVSETEPPAIPEHFVGKGCDAWSDITLPPRQ